MLISPKKELYHVGSVVQSWVSGNPGYSLTYCFSWYIVISLILLKQAAPIYINPGLNYWLNKPAIVTTLFPLQA